MTSETAAYVSSQEDTIWLAVLVAESIVIVIINAFILIAFARNRQLRRRSTYLMINLSVADLLVGAVTGPLDIYNWERDHGSGFNWQNFSIFIAYETFPIACLIYLCSLSLERLHATVFPFKHSLTEEWFYFKTIICSWLLALLLASVDSVLYLLIQVGGYYLRASLIVLTLLILTLSYVIIIMKVKSSTPPLPGGAVASDRKLSVTLFIVTTVSILTILPYAIYSLILFDMLNELSLTTQSYIKVSVYALYYACSIVNPLIYAIRMQEFRTAVFKQLICWKTADSSRAHPIELNAM